MFHLLSSRRRVDIQVANHQCFTRNNQPKGVPIRILHPISLQLCLSLSLSHYIINCHGIGIGIQFQFIHSVDGCWRSQHSARALWLPLHMALSISLQLPIDENQPLMNCIESVLWHATLLCTHKPAVTLSLSQQDQPVLLALETIHGKSLISVSIGFDKCAELVVGWEVPASKQKLHRERQREREREREKKWQFQIESEPWCHWFFQKNVLLFLLYIHFFVLFHSKSCC